jgi:alpha-N-arabinofuranosidase
VSAWLGAEGGAIAVAGVYAVTKRGQLISGELKEPSGGSGLTHQETFVDLPNDPNIGFVVFLCMVHGTSGNAYVDDLYIGKQPRQAPLSRDTPTPSLKTPGFGGDNLAKNPSFEASDRGQPSEWTVDSKVVKKGLISLVRGESHTGQFSLKLTPNQNNDASTLGDNPFGVAQGFPADQFRGKRVYISGWLGAEGGSTAVLGLYAIAADGHAISAELKEPSGPAGLSYQQDELLVPTDRGTAFLIFACFVYGKSGAAYFDDVYFGFDPPAGGPMQTATGVSSGPQTRADQELEASIGISADHIRRDIPSTLFGSNIEWIWDGNGIWDSGRNRLNDEVVRLTRDLAPSLIRFPGGFFSDFYHWRDGIGPQSARIEALSMPGGARSRHAFGTDEALSFAEAVSGQLLITVNAGTGSPEEAADWVRYVNKSRRRVEYWEVGNEIYLNDGSPVSKAFTMPPDRYARKVIDFAKAMREADPSIKVGAIADESLNPSQPKGYRDWTEQVLRTAGAQIDFIAVHNAYAPGLNIDKGWNVRTVYAAMLAAPVFVRQSLEKLSTKIDALNPGSRIRIAVTEFGPYFQISDGRFVDHVKTLGSALYVGSVMNAFIESPRMDIANSFKLVDSLFTGWIGKRGDRFLPAAPYYASQMYTRHFGKKLIESSTESPTYDSQSVGIVDRMYHVPYLDVIASKSADGSVLYILGVNKHFDRPIKAKIRVQGFRPSGGAAWVLTGKSIDSNTGTEPVQAAREKLVRQAVDEVGGRFDKGAPGEIVVLHTALRDVAPNFEYEFPPHSIVSLEIDGR